jgi:DNA polymerase-3 subunit beta
VNLTADRAAFLAAAEAAKRATDPKNATLSRVRLEALGDRVELFAMDPVLSLSASVPAGVSRTGAFGVPADALVDALSAMPEGDVALAIDGSRATVKGGRRKAEIAAASADDYPEMPPAPREWVAFPAAALLRLLEGVDHAMSGDAARTHLFGVLVESDGSTLTAVATDGQRLSRAQTEASGAPLSVILPRKLVEAAKKALGDGEAAIGLTKTRVYVKAGEVTIGASLVEAVFPAYRQVIPQAHDRTARAPRSALLDALSAVRKMSSLSSGNVRLKFEAAGFLEIEAENPERGKGRDVVEIALEGRNLLICAKATYLIDALSACPEGGVVVEMEGELDPIVIRPAEGSEQLHLVMPARA